VTSPISADVESAFHDLVREAALLAQALDRFRVAHERLDEATRWVVVSGLAAGCEKIYSGCERVMDILAKRIDGMVVEKTDRWHSTLLHSMARPIPNVRSAVISEPCRAALDRFRAFRHRIRSSYGMALDADIVLERAAELGPVLKTFHREVTEFLAARGAEASAADQG
jgi:hypothetical protein